MSRIRTVVAASGAAVLAAVAALSGPGSAAAASAPSRSSLHFGACPASSGAPRGVYCARLSVPLDYAHPHGRHITIVVSAVGDIDAPRAMLVNPGGPGEPGIGTESFVWSKLPEKVTEQDTVYSFDPRGVGASTPISCGNAAAAVPTPQLPSRPTNASQERAHVREARTIAARCAKHAGSMLPYLTVANEARDMDRIRAAIGKPRIDYLGYSAGSQLGATYATLFPTHVGRMVLDSIVDPTASVYEQGYEQDPAFQKRVEQMFSWAAARNRTYHLGTTRVAVQKAWYATRAKLAAHPAGKVAGSAELDQLTVGAAYVTFEWDNVFSTIADYRKRHPAGLIAAAQQLHADVVDPGSLAYTCNDRGFPHSWSTWHRDTVRADRTAPLIAWLKTWNSAPCAFWPVHAEPAVRIGSVATPPILLLEAKDDPATPLIGAVRMHHALRNSALIVHGGGDHAAYLTDRDRCLEQRTNAYWLTGTLPRSGSCPAPGTA